MDDSQELEMSSLEAQLVCLYADRERLEMELGTADAEPILLHIRSLEEKLRSLKDEARDVAGDPESEDFELRLAEVVTERESFFEDLGVSSYAEARACISDAEQTASNAAEAMGATVIAPTVEFKEPAVASAPELDAVTAKRLGVASVAELVERYDELEHKLIEERSQTAPAAAVPSARTAPAAPVAPAGQFGDAGLSAAEVRAFVDGLGGGLKNAKLRFEGQLQSGSWSFSAGAEG